MTQKAVWSVPQPAFTAGSVMATGGGLVFAGSVDGTFNAYADTTGKKLWSFAQDTPVIAPPISFMVGSKQYVTVLSGLTTGFSVYGPSLAKFRIDPRTQARRVLTFALGGKETLPPNQPPGLFRDDPSYKPDPQREAAGAKIYGPRCLFCHGMSLVAAGAAPDLRRSGIPLSADAFASVVRGCAMVAGGMPCYGEFTATELADLRQYLRAETQAAKNREAKGD